MGMTRLAWYKSVMPYATEMNAVGTMTWDGASWHETIAKLGYISISVGNKGMWVHGILPLNTCKAWKAFVRAAVAGTKP